MKYNPVDGGVTKMFAWLSVDKDNVEGIIAVRLKSNEIMPLVATNVETAELCRDAALLAGAARKSSVRLVEFSSPRVVWQS